ncbi:MAG: tetratricopeptide repeat protein [Tepidisphaeraceae bacterium]|jgi:tetratricopeptide (TPR) repeat protein
MKKIFTIGFLALNALLLGCATNHNNSAETANAEKNAVAAKPPKISANSHFAAGQLAEANGENDKAISQYTECLKINPKHQAALYQLGVLYSSLKQYDDALDVFQRYVKATNGAASAYNDLGYCYEQSGDTDDAAQAYQQGIAADTKNAPCRTNYGLLLAKQNKIEEAIRVWQPVLSDAEVHYNLASVYEQAGRKQEAKVEFQKAVQLDPNFQDAKNRLAELTLN